MSFIVAIVKPFYPEIHEYEDSDSAKRHVEQYLKENGRKNHDEVREIFIAEVQFTKKLKARSE